jgi:hypothetical protein
MAFSRKDKVLLFLVWPVVTLVSAFWMVYSLTSYRLLCVPIFLTAAGLYLCFRFHRRWSLLIAAQVVFWISTFLPVDISLNNVPGPPRFAPLVMGLPTKEGVEKARLGEVVLGGCIVTGNEPRLVLVW